MVKDSKISLSRLKGCTACMLHGELRKIKSVKCPMTREGKVERAALRGRILDYKLLLYLYLLPWSHSVNFGFSVYK